MSTASERLERDETIRRGYATDASGLLMVPDAVARPASEQDVVELLREATATRTPVTPAGSQTSTTAASITDRGVLLSLRGMDRVIDVDADARTVRASPGVIVADLKRACADHDFLLALDPTSEEECTIGGAVACNASGARSLRYGATRGHVRALRVVLADGSVAALRRPALEKNTVGYVMAHDPVDWFVGSEGTLGVVTEVELALLPMPERVVGLALAFQRERDALAFIVAARESARVHPRCLEFFDVRALEIARAADGNPGWAAGAAALVYVEEAPPAGVETALDAWLELGEAHRMSTPDARVYESESELREARRIRHAVPAFMNERGAARRPFGGRKVSTDWAVPYRHLADALEHARALAERAGIEQAVSYGHAGNGHPHQNFIAHDADELARIQQVVEETLRHVISLGGTVAAEHGIGKLKQHWLPLQMSPLQVRGMRALKHELDPLGLLAPGNVL